MSAESRAKLAHDFSESFVKAQAKLDVDFVLVLMLSHVAEGKQFYASVFRLFVELAR
jgi:hypothetical protein